MIERYIDLAVAEKAPEVYKPREGKVNSNLEKYNREQLDFMFNYAKDLLTNFGYDDTYNSTGTSLKSKFVDDFN